MCGTKLALMMVISLSSAVWAEEGTFVRKIDVAGTVEVETVPDQIVWNVRLVDTHKSLLIAKQANDQKMEGVLALQEKLGLAARDIQAGTLRVNREYERDSHGRQGAFKHFKVQRHVTILQHDLQRFDQFLKALVESAEVEMDFYYRSTRIHELRAETRLKALQAAKDKAKDMAKVADATLGRVLTVEEHRQDMSMHPYMIASNSAYRAPATVDVSDGGFVPTDMKIKVTVYASFELL